MFLATLVVFKFVFASLYILTWKFRFNFTDKYKIKRINWTKELKAIKKKAKREYCDDSTDGKEIEKEV